MNQKKKKKKGSKGSSPPRLDSFSPGTDTSNLKGLTQLLVCVLLGMASGSYQRMSLKQRPSTSGVNCCARCGVCSSKWSMGRYTCDVNRLRDLEEYGLEVPERNIETLVSVALPQMQLWPWLIHQEEEFVDPSDWGLSFSVNLSMRRSFHHLGHSIPFAA